MSKTEDIDVTHRLKIFKLKKDGLLPSQIAKKLKKDEASVNEVLGEFLNKAKGSVKDRDFRQAAFWYFQHKKYILGDDVDFPKLKASLKRARTDYPELFPFLKGETENKNIKVDTDFDTVLKLWRENYKNYEEETGEGFEAVLGTEGGGFVDDDIEDLFLDSVCKIIKNGKQFSGIYLDAGVGGRGILTSSDIFNIPDDCGGAKAQFSKIFQKPTNVNFKPDNLFKAEGGVSFIACDTSLLDKQEFQPIERKFSGEKIPAEGATINTYFYHGKSKISMTYKVTGAKSNKFNYDGKHMRCSVGAPLFCGPRLVGITSGESKDGGNEAIDISTVFSWLSGSEEGAAFEEGEEVLAKWTDGYEYPARIKSKTEKGYLLDYYEFGDVADQSVSTIRKKKSFDKTEKFLKDASCEGYISNFKKSELYLADLLEMNDVELKEKLSAIGVKSGSIKKISTHLQTFQTEKKSVGEKNFGGKSGSITKTGSETEEKRKKNFDELSLFLKELGVERYLQNIRDADYDLRDLLSMKPAELELTLKSLDVKHGTIMKIQNALPKAKSAHQQKIYGKKMDASRSYKIKKIENNPMGDGWQPSEDDLDLSDVLKKQDGTHSVRYACSKLLSGFTPIGIVKGSSSSSFYMYSTGHRKYFKISIIWESNNG